MEKSKILVSLSITGTLLASMCIFNKNIEPLASANNEPIYHTITFGAGHNKFPTGFAGEKIYVANEVGTLIEGKIITTHHIYIEDLQEGNGFGVDDPNCDGSYLIKIFVHGVTSVATQLSNVFESDGFHFDIYKGNNDLSCSYDDGRVFYNDPDGLSHTLSLSARVYGAQGELLFSDFVITYCEDTCRELCAD